MVMSRLSYDQERQDDSDNCYKIPNSYVSRLAHVAKNEFTIGCLKLEPCRSVPPSDPTIPKANSNTGSVVNP